MDTLKTLQIETYNYKGVTVKRIDTIEAGFSTLTAFPTRNWFVNNKKAFTVDLNGEIVLASYLEKEADEGGLRTYLKDFKPECGFRIDEKSEVVKEAMNELGKYVEHEVKNTEC